MKTSALSRALNPDFQKTTPRSAGVEHTGFEIRIWFMLRVSLALVLTLSALSAVASSNPVDLAPRYLASGSVLDPAIATDGDSFLVAWRDVRANRSVILARRIHDSGDLTDFTGIILGDAPQTIDAPAVVWNGTTYLVVWRRNGGLASAAVSRDGRVISTEQHYGPAGVEANYPVALAWNGTKHMAVVDTNHRLSAMFLAPDGRELSRWFPVPGGRGQGAQAVASNGSDFLVVFSDFDAGVSVVQAMRIDANGGSRDAAAIQIARTPIPGTSYRFESSYPAVAWDGSRYVVIWTTDGVRARTVDAGGKLGTEQVLAPAGERVAIAVRDGELFLAWNTPATPLYGSAYDLTIATMRADVIEQKTTLAAQYAIRVTRPAIAADAGAIVVVRPNDTMYGQKSYDALLADAKTPLAAWSTEAKPLFIAIAAFGQYAPRVLTSGDRFLATWSESVPRSSRGNSSPLVSRNFAAPVALDGTVLAAPTMLSEDIYGINGSRGAFAGGRYLIVWSTFEPPNTRTIGTLVDEAGNVVKPPFTIASNTYGSFGHNPVVVSDGSQFLIIDFVGINNGPPYTIVAQRVAIDGTVGSREPLIANLAEAPYGLEGDLAFGRLALAWHDFDDSAPAKFAEFTSTLKPLSSIAMDVPYLIDVVVAPDATFVTSIDNYPAPAQNVTIVRDGTVRTISLPLTGNILSSSAARTDSGLVVAWSELVAFDSFVRLATVSSAGDVGSIVTVERLNQQAATDVAIAAAGGHLLLAFERAESSSVYGAANRILIALDPKPRSRVAAH